MIKKRKIIGMVISIIVFLVVLFWSTRVMIHNWFYPTNEQYPDRIIYSMNRSMVEEKYGHFDIEYYTFGAYYLYTDEAGDRHYYIMFFSDMGCEPYRIVEDTKFVFNDNEYYDKGGSPDIMGLDYFLNYYHVEVLRRGKYLDLDGVCDYFKITRAEFEEAYAYKYVDMEMPESVNFEKEGYSVSFVVDDGYRQVYSVSCTISNNSGEQINDWAILYDLEDPISTPVGLARKLYESNHIYFIDGYSYCGGMNLDVGAETGFGYTANYSEHPHMPTDCCVGSCSYVVEEDDYEVSYFVAEEWQGGAIALVVINNCGEKDITDWSILFTTEQRITNIDNANISSISDNEYIIHKMDDVTVIAPGEFVTVAVTLDGSETASVFEKVAISEIELAP